MNQKLQSRYEARAGIFKALAHPSRLFIVDELSKGRMCVCELTGLLGVDVSTVSKHLSVLKNAGLVEDQKLGLNVFYTLKICCLGEFLDCVENVLRRNAEDRAAILK